MFTPEEISKLENKNKGKSSQKSTNKKSGTKKSTSIGRGISTEAGDNTSNSKALPRTSTIDFDALNDLKTKFKTNFFEESLSLAGPGANLGSVSTSLNNDYSAIRVIEQGLHSHTKSILDAVTSKYRLPENKIEQIRANISQAGSMTFKFAALTTSWIGRYLKLMEYLLTNYSDHTVENSLT